MPNPMRADREVTRGWHPDEQRWLERFREALAADYAEVVNKALLFGSKARGDGTTASDIDVMVIVRDEAADAQESIADMADELVSRNGCIGPTRVVHCACGSDDEHEPGAHGRPGRTAAEWAVVEAEEHDRHYRRAHPFGGSRSSRTKSSQRCFRRSNAVSATPCSSSGAERWLTVLTEH